MKNTAADVLVETMIDWGIDTVFGMPGDGINGVMEALRVRQDQVRFIQVRHEESAALMACAYAKWTGKLGCCLATSGPGGIHLLNGLYDAKMDQAPVLAITGQTFSDLKGSRFQQEVNMALLFADVSCYNQEVINPNQVEMLANEACRHALNSRGVAHITFPADYQVSKVTGKTSMHKRNGSTSHKWDPPLCIPREELIRQAAQILNECERPAILIGQGARGAAAEIIALAEKLGAPIAKALLGKDVIPDDHPLTTGGIGLLGTTPSLEVMESCDALLMIGTSFPYAQFLPKPGQARGIQIDDKANQLGLRYPIELGLVGDTKPTVAALSKHIYPKAKRSFLQKAQQGKLKWRESLEKQADFESEPIKPQLAAKCFSDAINDDAIISGDSGSNTVWLARFLEIRGTQKYSCSGTLATMACGLPYAIAAKLAFPERQSVAFVGDGGFSMLMSEFVTAVKYDLPIVIVIAKNNVLAHIKWEQIVFQGNPEYGVELQSIDFAKFAESCGGVGYSISKPQELKSTLAIAMDCGKPTIVEIVVDPNEPPIPPKVEIQQAMHFMEALAKGQPQGGILATKLLKDKIKELT